MSTIHIKIQHFRHENGVTKKPVFLEGELPVVVPDGVSLKALDSQWRINDDGVLYHLYKGAIDMPLLTFPVSEKSAFEDPACATEAVSVSSHRHYVVSDCQAQGDAITHVEQLSESVKESIQKQVNLFARNHCVEVSTAGELVRLVSSFKVFVDLSKTYEGFGSVGVGFCEFFDEAHPSYCWFSGAELSEYGYWGIIKKAFDMHAKCHRFNADRYSELTITLPDLSVSGLDLSPKFPPLFGRVCG